MLMLCWLFIDLTIGDFKEKSLLSCRAKFDDIP